MLMGGGLQWGGTFFFFFNPNATGEDFGAPHENMPIHVFRQQRKKLSNSISYLPTPDDRSTSRMTTTAISELKWRIHKRWEVRSIIQDRKEDDEE